MKASKELINNLSSSLWNVLQAQIESVLNGFEGNPIEETPPQRDWTGVRFSGKPLDVSDGVIEKVKDGEYRLYAGGFLYGQEELDCFFSKGSLIEIPNEEQSTIHAEKPRDPLNLFDMEKRLKAAEDTIDVLSRDKENLWVSVKALETATFGSKQNLDIEDWKTVECLCYEKLLKFFNKCDGGYFKSNLESDLKALEAHIKQKLNK